VGCRCSACGERLDEAWYELQGPRCLRHAVAHRPTLLRSLLIALVVGTLLLLINQLDVLVSGKGDAGVYAKVGLTFLVPFAVATVSALASARRRTQPVGVQTAAAREDRSTAEPTHAPGGSPEGPAAVG
jgi:hypothetical protein